MTKTQKWAWANPLTWMEAIATVLLSILSAISRLFGLSPAPSTEGFENIQSTDVENAAERAVAKETVQDEAISQMTPAEVLHAYATATEDARATMDFGNLVTADQDWILALSDVDLVLLGAGGIPACARALKQRCVSQGTQRLRKQERIAPQTVVIKEQNDDDHEENNRAYVRARFRDLLSSRPGPDQHLQSAHISLH